MLGYIPMQKENLRLTIESCEKRGEPLVFWDLKELQTCNLEFPILEKTPEGWEEVGKPISLNLANDKHLDQLRKDLIKYFLDCDESGQDVGFAIVSQEKTFSTIQAFIEKPS